MQTKRELTWPWLQQQPRVSAGVHHILPSKLPAAAHDVAVAPGIKQAGNRKGSDTAAEYFSSMTDSPVECVVPKHMASVHS